jgi:predicted carbohydrate-binding protein with CBM5 and CBM33 domain
MRAHSRPRTMNPCSSKLLAVAVAVCVMSSWLSTADAHAALQFPVSRNVAYFQAGGPGVSAGLWPSTAGIIIIKLPDQAIASTPSALPHCATQCCLAFKLCHYPVLI